jgi:hypothetical protein
MQLIRQSIYDTPAETSKEVRKGRLIMEVYIGETAFKIIIIFLDTTPYD